MATGRNSESFIRSLIQLTYTYESARFISTRDDGMLSELPEMTILASGNARLLETLSMEQFASRVRLSV